MCGMSGSAWREALRNLARRLSCGLYSLCRGTSTGGSTAGRGARAVSPGHRRRAQARGRSWALAASTARAPACGVCSFSDDRTGFPWVRAPPPSLCSSRHCQVGSPLFPKRELGTQLSPNDEHITAQRPEGDRPGSALTGRPLSSAPRPPELPPTRPSADWIFIVRRLSLILPIQ